MKLKHIDRWVAWQYEKKNDIITKVPCNIYRQHIDITKPQNWYPYQIISKALKDGKIEGIGFVFAGDGIIGIDIDKVETEEERKSAEYWIEQFDSYTERSPSGKGYHVFIEGKIPGDRRKNGKYEIYENKRFFTFTCDVVLDREVRKRDEVLKSFYNSMIEPPIAHISAHRAERRWETTQSMPPRHNRFQRLFNGDTTGYPSQSEAEMAFCSYAAMMSNNEQEIDNLMRQSRLYRDKWESRRGNTTYGLYTIRKVLR